MSCHFLSSRVHDWALEGKSTPNLFAAASQCPSVRLIKVSNVLSFDVCLAFINILHYFHILHSFLHLTHLQCIGKCTCRQMSVEDGCSNIKLKYQALRVVKVPSAIVPPLYPELPRNLIVDYGRFSIDLYDARHEQVFWGFLDFLVV